MVENRVPCRKACRTLAARHVQGRREQARPNTLSQISPSPPSLGAHVALAFRLRPGERRLHRIALSVANYHLGLKRLSIDLQRNGWRGWGANNDVLRIAARHIMVDRALRRGLFGPGFEVEQFGVWRQ